MRLQRLKVIGYGICFLGVWGCVPMAKVSQEVRLRVTASGSGRPVAGARVWIKRDYDPVLPVPPGTSAEGLRQTKCENWDNYPWPWGVTDEWGVVKIVPEEMGEPRPLGFLLGPRSWLDIVSGKRLQVRVKTDNVDQVFRPEVRPGALDRGKVFTVRFLEIKLPKYVETKRR